MNTEHLAWTVWMFGLFGCGWIGLSNSNNRIRRNKQLTCHFSGQKRTCYFFYEK